MRPAKYSAKKIDVHNETGELVWPSIQVNEADGSVNIHSHSLGALFYLILLPLHLLPTHFPSFSRSNPSDPLPTPPEWQDKLALTIYLLCAVGCLSLSSWFHTVQCHSKALCDSAHRGDYVSPSRRPNYGDGQES